MTQRQSTHEVQNPILFPVVDVTASPKTLNIAENKVIIHITNVEKVPNDKPFDPQDPWRDYRFRGRVLNANESISTEEGQTEVPTYMEFRMGSLDDSVSTKQRSINLLQRLHAVEILKKEHDLSIYGEHVSRETNVEHAKITDFQDRATASHLLQYGLNPAPDGTAPFDLKRVNDNDTAKEQLNNYLNRIEEVVKAGYTKGRTPTPVELIDKMMPSYLSSTNVGLSQPLDFYSGGDSNTTNGSDVTHSIHHFNEKEIAKIILGVSPNLYNDLFNKSKKDIYEKLSESERQEFDAEWQFFSELHGEINGGGDFEPMAYTASAKPVTAHLDLPISAETLFVTPPNKDPYYLIRAKYTNVHSMKAYAGTMPTASILPSVTYNIKNPFNSDLSLCQVEEVHHHVLGNCAKPSPDDPNPFKSYLKDPDTPLADFSRQVAELIIQNHDIQESLTADFSESHQYDKMRLNIEQNHGETQLTANVMSPTHVTVAFSSGSYATHNRGKAGELYYSRKFEAPLPTVSFTDFRQETLQQLATLTHPDYQILLKARDKIDDKIAKRADFLSDTFFKDIKTQFFAVNKNLDGDDAIGNPVNFLDAHHERKAQSAKERVSMLPPVILENYPHASTDGQMRYNDDRTRSIHVGETTSFVSILQESLSKRIDELLPQYQQEYIKPLIESGMDASKILTYDLNMRVKLWRDVLTEIDVSFDYDRVGALNRDGESINEDSSLRNLRDTVNKNKSDDEPNPFDALMKAVNYEGESLAFLTTEKALTDLQILRMETQAVILNLPVVHDELVKEGILTKKDVAPAKAFRGVSRISPMWRMFAKPFGEKPTEAEQKSGWVGHPLAGLNMAQVTTLSGSDLNASNLFSTYIIGLNSPKSKFAFANHPQINVLDLDRHYSEKLLPNSEDLNENARLAYAQLRANTSYSLTTLNATVMQGNHFGQTHNLIIDESEKYRTKNAMRHVFALTMYNQLDFSRFAEGLLNTRGMSGSDGLERSIDRLNNTDMTAIIPSRDETTRSLCVIMGQGLSPHPAVSRHALGLTVVSVGNHAEVRLGSICNLKATGAHAKQMVSPRNIGDDSLMYVKGCQIPEKNYLHSSFDKGQVLFSSHDSLSEFSSQVQRVMSLKSQARVLRNSLAKKEENGINQLFPNDALRIEYESDQNAYHSLQERIGRATTVEKNLFPHADAVIGINSYTPSVDDKGKVIIESSKETSLSADISDFSHVVKVTPNQAVKQPKTQSELDNPTSLDGAMAKYVRTQVISQMKEQSNQFNTPSSTLSSLTAKSPERQNKQDHTAPAPTENPVAQLTAQERREIKENANKKAIEHDENTLDGATVVQASENKPNGAVTPPPYLRAPKP